MTKGADAAAGELVRMAERSQADWFATKRARKNNEKTGLVLCPESYAIAHKRLPWSKTSPYATPLSYAAVLAMALGIMALLGASTTALAVVGGLGGVLVLIIARKWIAMGRDSE